MKRPIFQLFLLLFSSSIFAQNDGQIDSTFGVNGVGYSNISGGSVGSSFKFDSNNNIIACGNYYGSGNYDFAATKFNSLGIIDTSFALNGKFIYDFGIDDYANAVLVQPDDKIILGGFSSTWDGFNVNSNFNQFSLIRLHNNGTIDSTFGINGKFELDFDPIDCGAVAMALQSDGKIIAVGKYFNGSSLQFLAIRITTNGVLDNSFGNTGISRMQLDTLVKDDEVTCCLVQPDDKIVIGGLTYDQPSVGRVFGMVRLTANGLLDASFGLNGIVKTDIPNQGNDVALAMAQQIDGRILLAGTCKNSKIMAICRYNTDGSLDGSFGNQGIDTLNISLGKDIIYGVLIAEDEKIIIVGQTSSNACILRLKKDGQIDTTFNHSGINYFGNSTGESFNNVLLMSPNKIIAAGYAKNSNQVFQLAVVAFNSLLYSGINEQIAKINELKLYPNPTNNLLYISNINNDEVANTQLQVYNTLGQVVYEEFNINLTAAQIISIDTKLLLSGVYYVTVTNLLNTQTSKFIKN